MARLRDNFTLEVLETQEIELGPVVTNTEHTWDRSIPSIDYSNLEIHTSISDGKYYEYRTEINLCYTDPNAPVVNEENTPIDNRVVVLNATLGHHKDADILLAVLNTFPQYFTE